jgi:hypothetical protein
MYLSSSLLTSSRRFPPLPSPPEPTDKVSNPCRRLSSRHGIMTHLGGDRCLPGTCPGSSWVPR